MDIATLSIEEVSPDITFPWRLYIMLRDAYEENFDDIICWVDGGKSFLIKKPDSLDGDLLSTYFKSSKYQSFRRQLINYGFTCIDKKRRQCKTCLSH